MGNNGISGGLMCILVVATYEKKLGLHFGEELPT